MSLPERQDPVARVARGSGMSSHVRPIGWVALAGTLVWGAAACPLSAQRSEGLGAAEVAGAALGFYSGGAVAVVGSLFPCNRTLLGPKCVAVSGAVGAGVGLMAGRVIGRHDADGVRDRARGALYGTIIGGGVGAVLQQAVRQYGWTDAVTVALFGGAVGAAPRGTLVGTGAGAALGGVLWLAHRRDGLPNLMLLTVLGGAVGGLYEWVDGALDADRAGGPSLAASFSIAIR